MSPGAYQIEIFRIQFTLNNAVKVDRFVIENIFFNWGEMVQLTNRNEYSCFKKFIGKAPDVIVLKLCFFVTDAALK